MAWLTVAWANYNFVSVFVFVFVFVFVSYLHIYIWAKDNSWKYWSNVAWLTVAWGRKWLNQQWPQGLGSTHLKIPTIYNSSKIQEQIQLKHNLVFNTTSNTPRTNSGYFYQILFKIHTKTKAEWIDLYYCVCVHNCAGSRQR